MTIILQLFLLFASISDVLSIGIFLEPNSVIYGTIGKSITINFTAAWDFMFDIFTIERDGSVVGYLRDIEVCKFVKDKNIPDSINNSRINITCQDGRLKGFVYIENINLVDNGTEIRFLLTEITNKAGEDNGNETTITILALAKVPRIDLDPYPIVYGNVGSHITVNFTATWEHNFSFFKINTTGVSSIIGYIPGTKRCIPEDEIYSNYVIRVNCLDKHLNGVLHKLNVDALDNNRGILFELQSEVNTVVKEITIHVADLDTTVSDREKNEREGNVSYVIGSTLSGNNTSTAETLLSFETDTTKLPRSMFHAIIASVSVVAVCSVFVIALCVFKRKRRKRLNINEENDIELEDSEDMEDTDTYRSLSPERDWELLLQAFDDFADYENDCIERELEADSPYEDLEEDNPVQNQIDWPYEEVDRLEQASVEHIFSSNEGNPGTDSNSESSAVVDYSNVFVTDGYENCNMIKVAI